MGPEITWQAGVMDMVSTTGVEVMTEVVTEASVGEAALISLPVRFILYIYIYIYVNILKSGLSLYSMTKMSHVHTC